MGNGKLFVLLLFVIMLCPPARAEEAAQVRIPVLAFGADCTAVLYDSEENVLQALPLRVGETSAFAVHCVGLQRFTYTVRLLDQDTDTVKYDHTQYHIHVDLFAELERRTGISRGKLRGMKQNGFKRKRHGSAGKTAQSTVLSDFTGVIDPILVVSRKTDIYRKEFTEPFFSIQMAKFSFV